MAPGDVCHGPRCSLAGLGPVALEYRSCHWPGGSAGSPQCVRPMGCWFFPVPRPPYVCAVSWASRLLFTGVPARCVVLRVRCPGPPGSCSPVRPLGVLCCVCGVLGLPAPVHRCARSVCCFACAVSWASGLLFTGVPARCVVLCVRCPGPLGSCSPVCPLGVLFCVCGVLGLPAPVHRCARSVCCFACAVSWPSWLLFTGAPARCVVLRVRCPGPPGSCSPMCPFGVLFCVCGVLGLPAPVHRCARSLCCVVCAVSWASRLLFTGVPARCVVLLVRCPRPPGSCSPVCPLGVLCCVCGVLGLPAPVHRCARSVCCFACAVSWASRLLFTCVPALCVVLCVRCPGPPGPCSPVCPLGVLFCVCGVLDLPAHVHQCARSVCCVACAVSWASRLLFTGVPALGVVLRVRCPGPPGSCSPVCPLCVLCCVCGVLGLPAAVHRCARSVCCFACAVSWASWLPFTGVPARCVVLRVRCPGPPSSCSPVCPLGVLCCVCGVLGLPAPVHRCARSVCCFACAVSWASQLLFTGVPARCVVLRVRCPGPPGSCSPVCPLGVLFYVCGVLGLPAPVHRCARSVCCFACAVSWASRLLFTGVPARCVVLRVRCPGPPGYCSPVRPLGVLCCVCGVLGLPAPVHRCARSVCCFACAVSGASRLLFTGVLALCAVRWVACGVLLCGVSLRGAHSSIRTAAVRSRQGLVTLRARTRLSGRRLFIAGRGWVPFGRALVHPDGGCSVAGRGWVPSGRALVHPDGSWCACACFAWPGRAGRPPGRVLVRLTFASGRFVFLLCLAPSGLGLPPSLSLPLPFLVALALCFGCFSRAHAAWLSVRSRLVCFSRLAVGFSLVVAPPPLPFCVSRFPSLLLGALVFSLFFFFFCLLLLPLCAPVVSCFLWFPAPRALGFGAVRCLLCWPSASRLSVRWSLFRAFRLAVGCSLVVAPPPPLLCVSRFSSLPLAAVCRVLCVPVCGAAPRCCALCPPVLCCRVLCCVRLVPLLVAPSPLALPVALGPCALRRCVLRCSPALCALCCVCFVVARWCVLLFAALSCAVCVPGCCAVRSLSSPLCAVLCFAVLVRSGCAVRVVRAVAGAWCCGALLCVVLFPVVCRGAVSAASPICSDFQ